MEMRLQAVSHGGTTWSAYEIASCRPGEAGDAAADEHAELLGLIRPVETAGIGGERGSQRGLSVGTRSSAGGTWVEYFCH